MSYIENHAKLETGKVYWSDRDFLFRKDGVNTCSAWISTSGQSRFKSNNSMHRDNFTDPTPQELQWFEYCEQQQQYISFTDYQTLIVPTLNSIQLYPLC